MERIKKIQEAVLDMMSKVKFCENGHTYQNVMTGEWLQGVSSVSSIVPKDWLAAWGAKEAVKALGFSDFAGDTETAERVLAEIKACKNIAKYVAILKEAKGASGRKSKTALVDGRVGHEWLEKYVLAKIRKTELPAIPEGLLARPITQFLEWEIGNVAEWILSEARVAYLEKKYAGMLDAMALMKSGKLAIIDFKFASHISEDYFLQTSGYAMTFEPYGITVDQRIIVRLPKTLEIAEWNKKEKKYKMVENTIEICYVPTDYQMDKEVFLHCIQVKKWINLVTKRGGE